MIPIFLHDVAGTRGLGFSEFESRVLQICEEHQQARRACAFAFVLQDASTPHVGKVLDDPGYWAALDAISGHALTVFSIFTGTLRLTDDFPPERHAADLGNVRRGTKRVLDLYFDVTEPHFPSVLFFQVRDGSVSGSRLVKLKERRIEAAYGELSDLLKIAADAVRDSVGKPIRDPDAAFDNLDRALTGRALKDAGKGVLQGVSAIQPWLEGLFKWM